MPTAMRLHVHLNVAEEVGPAEAELFRTRVRNHIRAGKLGGAVLNEVLDHVGPPTRRQGGDVPMAVSVVEEQQPVADYQILLQEYMRHVLACEGTTYVRSIGEPQSGVPFTSEQAALLRALNDKVIAQEYG